jgi:hypothetical protein
MRRGSVLTVTVMLSLGLGIGATTAIFSLIHAVMLKSLPVAGPNRLYRLALGRPAATPATRRASGASSPSTSVIAMVIGRLLGSRLYQVGTLDPSLLAYLRLRCCYPH